MKALNNKTFPQNPEKILFFVLTNHFKKKKKNILFNVN